MENGRTQEKEQRRRGLRRFAKVSSTLGGIKSLWSILAWPLGATLSCMILKKTDIAVFWVFP